MTQVQPSHRAREHTTHTSQRARTHNTSTARATRDVVAPNNGFRQATANQISALVNRTVARVNRSQRTRDTTTPDNNHTESNQANDIRYR